jgi:hypothetical protein
MMIRGYEIGAKLIAIVVGALVLVAIVGFTVSRATSGARRPLRAAWSAPKPKRRPTAQRMRSTP